ncbi:MAG: AMP-binding protein [Actinobacteria bacterium]|nr:AMP-binding protein [Actinomycetota bacterium]
MALISFSRRLHDLAAQQPDALAVTCGNDSLTRAELVRYGDDLAVHLQRLGVSEGDMVTVAVPNSVDWFIAYLAIWRLGAIPQPISARLPQREVDALLELADPSAVVGLEPEAVGGRPHVPLGFRADAADASHLPDLVSRAWKAPTSGGSTGRPKLIVSGDPALFDTEAPPALALGTDGCLIMPGPLYHNGPAVWSCQALLNGNHVVLLPRFDAEGTLAAIEQYRGTVLYMVPTMMKRIWRLHDDVRHRYDVSSLRIVWHLAEPCPDWLKQCWIDWLGPERIYELYAGTEAQTATIINGVDWLAHRGSVGKPLEGTVKVTDEDGNEVPVGEKGEVWMRNPRDTPTYRYIGAEPRTLHGGWESLGDMGHLDADGYLYLGDRAADMILSGGANIYPAEVEAALQEHPAIHSCAVIGLPDEDKGNAIHAIIEADAASIDLDELKQFLGERLVVYKLPRTFEFVDTPLRDDAGKVRRSALRQERL